MERASRYIVFLLFSALLLIPIADAGTVFQAVDGGIQADPNPTKGPIEHFPTSSFGAHEAAEMDTPDEAGGSRSPASMDFGGGDVTHSSPRSAPPLRNIPPTEESANNDSMSSGLSGTINRSGVQEVAVIASDLGFFPRTLFVARDVPLRIFVTGASKNTLCIMMDSFQVRKQVRAQKIEEIEFTPETPGKYRFYCPVNGMEGTLVVKEFASSSHIARMTASNSDGN